MKITIVFALTAWILISPCNYALAFQDMSQSQINEIGASKIHPAHPLYFLKAIREILELKFALPSNVLAIRQLEFSSRRLREVNSLVGTTHQELIEPTLERYWMHLGQLIGIVNVKDETLATQVVEATTKHMIVLLNVYNQVDDKKAKISTRAAINRLSLWQQQFLDKLITKVSSPKLVEKIISSKLSACNFLQKEASASGLNDVEKVVLKDRATHCFNSFKEVTHSGRIYN